MDSLLVKAAREGSQAAFARLVERQQGPLRGFLRRAHGWLEADDIAQEAFVTAWSSLNRLRDDHGFRTWLFGIAWRKAQTAARSARRSAVRDHDWSLTEAQTAADGVGAEERLALEAALAQLSPEQRAAVTLCLAEGWSHGEAAEVLGLPLGTVKSHVTRGRDKLLASLGERT